MQIKRKARPAGQPIRGQRKSWDSGPNHASTAGFGSIVRRFGACSPPARRPKI